MFTKYHSFFFGKAKMAYVSKFALFDNTNWTSILTYIAINCLIKIAFDRNTLLLRCTIFRIAPFRMLAISNRIFIALTYCIRNPIELSAIALLSSFKRNSWHIKCFFTSYISRLYIEFCITHWSPSSRMINIDHSSVLIND